MSTLFGNLSQRSFNSFGSTTQHRAKRGVLSSKPSDEKGKDTEKASDSKTSSLISKSHKSETGNDLTSKWLNGGSLSESVLSYKGLKDSTKALDLTWGDEFLQKTQKGLEEDKNSRANANGGVKTAKEEKADDKKVTDKEKAELEGKDVGVKKPEPITAEPKKYQEKKEFLANLYTRIQDLRAKGYDEITASMMARTELNKERAEKESRQNKGFSFDA